jgi:hypothetical protein
MCCLSNSVAELILRELVVWITEQPSFSKFRGRNDRMLCRQRMLGCVTIRRVVAAQGCPTLLAGPQVNPTRADFHALLANPETGLQLLN